MSIVAWDTETYLIGPGNVAPKMVCSSFADETGAKVLGNGDPELVEWLDYLFQVAEFTGANVAYDLAVAARSYSSLIPGIFKALDEGRVHDVQIREKLINLASHGDLAFGPTGKQLSYSLASLAHKRVGLDLSAGKEGDDIWRLRYSELDGFKAADYPKEAYDYARLDAQATLEVHRHQDENTHPDVFRAEGLHVKAHFCLQLKTAWGLLVDAEEKARLEAWVDEQLSEEALSEVFKAGLVIPAQPPRPYAKAKEHEPGCDRKGCECPPKMTVPQPEKVRKKDALIPLIEEVSQQHGLEIKLTKTGQTSADKEVLKELAPLHPALEQFYHRQELIKLRTSYFPALEWPFGSGQTAKIIHPGYDPLKKTGRVSSRGTTKKNADRALYASVNIQQADPRVRGVYVPRPGWVYVACDFSSIDLCSLAQTIKDLYGHSTLLDQINAGINPHTFLGAVLAEDGDPWFAEQIRGLSPEKSYEVFASFKALDRKGPEDCAACVSGKHGNWFDHWRTFAKPVGLGFPGGLGAGTMVSVCAGYGLRITRAHAKRLRRLWLQVYPEMRRYLFKWVESQGGRYVSPRGMIRAGCNYTEMANGRALQTPAAEGMKEAMWRVTRACYDATRKDLLLGCKPVVNMHDELVVEVPDDDLSHDRAMRVSALMVEGMSTILPDVKIEAEPVLARRWLKKAKPVWKDGKLVPWAPEREAS